MEGFWPCRTLLGEGPGRELTLPFAAFAPLCRVSRGDSGDDLAGGRDERMAVVDKGRYGCGVQAVDRLIERLVEPTLKPPPVIVCVSERWVVKK